MGDLTSIVAQMGIPIWVLILLVLLVIWEVVWKLIALWKSARNNDLVWFILIALLNTVGILPIIYIFFFSEKKKISVISKIKKSAKKIVRKKR
ncbi:MAG: hypothetical protein QT05_C0001G0038 [archaeon GW2011_AR13]|nr:MAG: hypothetical protein QT05_C0001G0038 [archaeon GW2011_AR13]